jgi:chromosomal replication initiation ATPase DnaA
VTPREHMIILARIVAAASAVCAVSPRAVYAVTRQANPTHARMVSCWLACELLGVKETAVARMIGRDHTTVINARRRVGAQVETKAGPLYEIAAATIDLLRMHATPIRQEQPAA